MNHFKPTVCLIAIALAASTTRADSFNGVGEYQTNAHGYYYAVGGGLFPNGQIRNGDNASGGTIRFILDDPAWGGYPLGAWQKDDWFDVTSSLALTMKNGASVVFDNNGIETASVPAGFYTTPAGGTVVGYSMSNNFDWIYAGYFHLSQVTVVDQITGYFLVSSDPNSPAQGFNPNDPYIQFHSNIFSEVSGQLPKNTGSFAGDVFSSDTTAGAFSWSNTGFQRITSSSTSDIYRLNYTLATPITLAAGDYYFSTDASIATPLPGVLGLGMSMLGGFAAMFSVRKRLSRTPNAAH